MAIPIIALTTVLQERVVEVVQKTVLAKDIVQKAKTKRYPFNLASKTWKWLQLQLYV